MKTLKENCFKEPVYICGPMSNIEMNNKPAFNKMEQKLKKIGFKEIINPARLEATGKYKTWNDYIKKDITDLMKCKSIAILSGWYASKGARLELYIAEALGITKFTVCESKIIKMI